MAEWAVRYDGEEDNARIDQTCSLLTVIMEACGCTGEVEADALVDMEKAIRTLVETIPEVR